MKKLKIHLPKLTLSNRYGVILLAVLLIAGVTTAIIRDGSKPEKKQTEVVKKVDQLNQEEAPCQKIIDEVGSEQPDNSYSEEAKIKLLESQLLCFSDLSKFDNAIVAAERLKEIYDSKGDGDNSERVNKRIEELQELKKQEQPNDNTNT